MTLTECQGLCGVPVLPRLERMAWLLVVVAGLLEELALLRQKVPAPARAALDLPETAQDLRALADDAWQITADTLTAAETP